jgi:hypothetical protein
MYNSKINWRNVVAIAICLTVTTLFMGCKKNNKATGNVGDWPSSSVLKKYGLDGMSKPAGSANFFHIELPAGKGVSISFSGNAATAAAVKSYFSGDKSWEKLYELPSGQTTVTFYVKNSDEWFTVFNETPEGNFQIVAGRDDPR